jgi:outer membrane protein assembly factor BamE (lipoprotein component of BamABCDE complex)
MVKLSIFVILALVVSVALFFTVRSCTKNEDVMTQEKLEQILKMDLPVGMSKEQVEAYLNSKKYDYNFNPTQMKIEAMARDINKGLVVYTSVRIIIVFDKDNKLTGLTTEKQLTGI